MTENEKRYYWLKLKEDFFNDEAIEWLEEQQNGKEYVLFYLKLCLKSLKNNGVLIRQVGNMLVPYDIAKLSEITRTSVDTAAVALKALIEIGLVEVQDGGQLYLTQLQAMVGSTANNANAIRQQRFRDNQKQLNSGVTDGVTNRNVEYRDKSLELKNLELKSKEIEKKKEKKKTKQDGLDDPSKVRYAEAVALKPEEYNKLVEKFGVNGTTELCEFLSNYKLANGKTYTSDYHAIHQWAINAWQEQKSRRVQSNCNKPHFGNNKKYDNGKSLGDMANDLLGSMNTEGW